MKKRYSYIVDWEAGSFGKRRWFAQVIENDTDNSVRFNWVSSREAGKAHLEYWRKQLESREALAA